MDHPPPTTPPPTTVPPASPVVSERSSLGITLIAVAFGIVAGLTIGVGVGWLAMASAAADCSPSDGWCGLGAAFAGLFFGAVSGAVAYVTAGVITIVRCRPAGRRARLIGTHLAIPPSLLVVAAILGAISEALA